MGGGGGGKEEVPLEKQVLAFGVFAIGNIGLNYFNSWALRGADTPGIGKGGFKFPFFYTMFHMAASSIAALLLQLTCARPKDGTLPSLRQLWTYKLLLLPMSMLTVLNNGLNNWSLTLVALFVNQVIKACGPAMAAVFEFLLLGKTYAVPIYLSVMCIVLGSAVSNISNFGQGDSSSLGIVVCLISLSAASLKPVLQKIITSGGNSFLAGPAPLEPAQAIVWDSGIAFLMFMVVWLLTDERQASIDYITSHTKNPNSGLLALGIITFGSCMAFSFNIANYYYIHYTSALTSTVGSNGIKIFLICITALTDGMTDPTTVLGIIIVVLAIISYAYLSFQEKHKKPAMTSDTKAGAATAADEKAEPLAPSETTPLTQQPEKSVFSAFPLVAVAICAACVAIIFAAVAIPMIIMHKDEEVLEANATNSTRW
jgi:hypothetical protein